MANTSLEGDLTLVFGGTGKTGRRLADLLRQADHGVRIGSRNAEPRFDWENRETWRPALQGVKAAYVAYQPDLAAPPGRSKPSMRSSVRRSVAVSRSSCCCRVEAK
jgi:uncharacterized protein YbjT (DUF2867 family)